MSRVQRTVAAEEIERLREFFAGYPQVAAVYLFGSYGTEFQLPSSDIDLGLIFTRSVDIKEELELDAELSCFLHTDKVDLVNLNRSPLNLQHRALSEGELLVEQDYVANSNFLEMVAKQYSDYQISHERFMVDYDAAIKEA